MQYRVSFIADFVTTGLANGLYFLTLYMVLQRFNGIGGWSIGEVAFLAGMAEMSFAAMDILFSGFDPDVFSPFIQQGKFDQVLLKPANISLQILGSKFILRRLGRFMEGVLIFSFAISATAIQWTAAKLLYLPVVFISQVLCFGALFISGATLIFWTIQRVEVVNILTYGGNEAISYPMNIYPDWLRRFLTYLIPFIFINYYPALFFLDKPDPFHWPVFTPFLAPGVAVIMMFAAYHFWLFGIKHYQSTGT
jgi:ABC-2 type transport system permease protein